MLPSVYKRFARWTDQGVWAQMHQHCCDDADLEYLIIDSTVVGAPLRTGRELPQKGWPGSQALGQEPRRVQHQDSRPSVDGLGQPHAIHPDRRPTALTSTQAEELIAGYAGEHVLADKGYDAQEFRQHPSKDLSRGMMPVTSEVPRSNRKAPANYDRHLYRGAPSGGMLHQAKVKHHGRIFSRS